MTNSEQVADAELARAASLRRIGRNLVNAQRIELMLKFLLGVNASVPREDIEDHLKKHVERISRKTLGALIPDLAETILLPTDAGASTLGAKDVWFSTSINVPMDPEARGAWSKEWETLRDERNKLVHLMLGNVDFSSPEQCQKLNLDLDAQNVLFLKGITFLRPIVTGTQLVIAAMASGELTFDPPRSDAPQK